MSSPRIVVIGAGAIGGAVLAGLRESGRFRLATMLRPGSPRLAALPEGVAALDSAAQMRSFAPALVVEAAGHGAVREHGPAALAAGAALLISSVGALHDAALLAALTEEARRAGARIILPSGAVAGLDHLRAVRDRPEARVRYVSRKPPSAWADELARRGVDGAAMTSPLVLHGGDARGAAARFPANLNVAATLALAGIGMDRTEVQVVVDPEARGNTHEIAVDSPFGELRLTALNRPSPDNPKTSAIVAASILAAVDQHFATVQFL